VPHYHFDVHTCFIARDEEGLELPDLEAAKASSVASARFLVIEELRRHNRFSPNHSIRIADAAGALLHTTRYGDCVDVRL
jgi:hypothetical protein